jgi:hypothetical protein
MTRFLPIFVLLAMGPTADLRAETYRATATSSMEVEVGRGVPVIHRRSVRHELFSAFPDDIKVGQPFELRLVTVTEISDGEPDDLRDTISVTVDALSGPTPRRIASFSDQGSKGTLSSPWFVTIQSGCCSPLTRFHVRDIETGTPLFTATGNSDLGLVALMTELDSRPRVRRWAAFEGLPGEDANDPAMLGYLRYGDRHGPTDTVELRMEADRQPQEFPLSFPECGALLWLVPGQESASGQPQRPAPDQCFNPPGLSYETPLHKLEHPPGTVGGFELELSLDGTVYAAIPVRDDRLDLEHARLERGVSLVRVSRPH